MVSVIQTGSSSDLRDIGPSPTLKSRELHSFIILSELQPKIQLFESAVSGYTS